MPKAKTEVAGSEIEILSLQRGRVSFAVVGETPIILNRMSEKARMELVIPRGKKTAIEKQQSLKHDPLREFRDSPYTLTEGPTLLAGLAVWFKRAMMTAALEIPGVKKAQIGRLVRVEGERVPLYGVPQMFMAITRSADMNRTPDVRTRAIVPKWAMLFDVTFAMPTLKEKAVANLLAAGGVFSGVGEWRTEKGSANFGSFRLASADDAELKEILETGGRDAQVAAMNSPTFYDDETDNLYGMFLAEADRRGFKVAA